MRTLSLRLRGQRGISLLEAMVSLVVLSLGLLGIAKLNAYLVATSGVAKVRSEAVALAEQKIEELRNQLVENETTTQDYASMVTSLTTDCSTGAPAGQKDTPASPLAAFTRVWCKLGTAINTQVQVSVLWTDGTGATQNVSLQSVVTWDSPLKSVAFAETGGGSAAQAFAKPPTGRAYVGKGTTTVDNSVAQMPDNLRMQHGADGYYRLVDPSGNVLLTGTGLNEQFSIITGRVYIDDGMYVTDPVSGFSANAKVATKEIFVSVSDAAYCSKIITSPISAIVDTSNASKKYKYFDYRCYIGAGWYGNVGILRVDSTQTKERVFSRRRMEEGTPEAGGESLTPKCGSTIFPSPVGQRSSRGQAAQSGRRASQTRRPWKMSWWCSSIQSSRGKRRQRSASTFSGVVALERPRRRATRKMCVSTARAGTPKALASTTLAVFWPTPGRAPRASGSEGTRPPCRATRAWPSPMRFFALLRKKPVDLMRFSSSSVRAPARLAASG